MIILGAIKDGFLVYRNNKMLWRFTLFTVAIFFVIAQFFKVFGSFFDFYGSLNFGTLFLLLLFMTIIETGLVEGVGWLRLGKEFRFSDIIQSLKTSGKHLPFLYIFLLIILSVSFFFLAPFLFPTGNLLLSVSFVDTMGGNMGLFSFALFFFLTPMIVRYFILRRGTYWRSIVEGVKILLLKFVDTVIFGVFFIISILLQLSIPVLISLIKFSWIDKLDITLENILVSTVTLITTPIGTLMAIPIFSFFLLWWSATLTLYFQEIQEATAEKPKWIRR